MRVQGARRAMVCVCVRVCLCGERVCVCVSKYVCVMGGDLQGLGITILCSVPVGKERQEKKQKKKKEKVWDSPLVRLFLFCAVFPFRCSLMFSFPRN